MEARTNNENLMNAISEHDIASVKYHIEVGADPNYTRFRDDEEPNGYIQPTTPLRLVMFCISDPFLEDNHVEQFAEIAQVLLRHGADSKPAMQIAEARYGKYNPNAKGNFMDVWHIVANGK